MCEAYIYGLSDFSLSRVMLNILLFFFFDSYGSCEEF